MSNDKTAENKQVHSNDLLCADCGTLIGKDRGPKDGWQLEDGRTVCHQCCVVDTKKFVKEVAKYRKQEIHDREAYMN